MTKNLQRTLAIISTLWAIFSTQNSFAVEIKRDSKPIISNPSTTEDPDLKLSIEELRKKYPIGWLKKKYGDHNHITCAGGDGAFEYDGPIPKNLVCSFFEIYLPGPREATKSRPIAKLQDFSSYEIKSVFVNADVINQNEIDVAKKNNVLVKKDDRIWEIAAIAMKYFEDNSVSQLTKEERKLRNFIYSDKIVSHFEKSWNCDYVASVLKYKDTLSCSKRRSEK